MKWCSEFELALHARNDVQRAGSGNRDVFPREHGCRRVVQAGREHSPGVGIRYGATLQSLLRIRSGDSSAHKMLRGEIVDYSRAHRVCEDPMQC